MPYTRIAGPEVLRLPQGNLVRYKEDLMIWLVGILAEKGNVATPARIDQKVSAYINWGHWRVDCPCGASPLTRPDWHFAACGECGALIDQIAFPENYADIERMLLKRPQRQQQNWFPTETLEALIEENTEHGLR